VIKHTTRHKQKQKAKNLNTQYLLIGYCLQSF